MDTLSKIECAHIIAAIDLVVKSISRPTQVEISGEDLQNLMAVRAKVAKMVQESQ